jgi:signal transduction histidine kinase/YHS domain-containing protein
VGGIPEIRELQRAMSGMVGHVRRAQLQSRVYAEQLADGQEKERQRIARELHDEAVQATIAIAQALDMSMGWLYSKPERAEQMLQLAREQALGLVSQLRNLISGLRPPALEELGLMAALEMQIGDYPAQQITLTASGEARHLPEAHALTLFRVAQEALRNVIRHSQATHTHIEVQYQPQGIVLRIEDDGCGFHPPSHLGDLAFQKHYGLLGIQERVNSLGGGFKLESQIGKGTTLHVYLPTQDTSTPDPHVRDPVCNALIVPQQAYGTVVYGEQAYYFCCPVCQGTFEHYPSSYAQPPPSSISVIAPTNSVP